MTLYVDHARLCYGRMKMSHLVADTLEELAEAAKRLGLQRWVQYRGEGKEHLDVCESKRTEAIKNLDAVPVTQRMIYYAIERKKLQYEDQ